ncbi:UDP-glucuronate:xylan alpha-glucuronosyltransferase 1 [Dichanthelium oligosanthes]|uniref:Hexosyltransferase n=1 Tax=Dichanthelium oligosanthes TaxID=888268 RepID=A0A1E5VB13_9POAL|nr:UDP-glucuronate:xylan alpha-glucuronosyltransferase 1 [Dichanthelium oligosanthes]
MTGGVRKRSGISKLLVILLFFACAIVALLVRGNGCCVVVQVAVLPRTIPASLWDAPPTAGHPSDDVVIPIPTTSMGAAPSSSDQVRQESEAVAASEEEEEELPARPYAADSEWEIHWESVARSLSSSSRNDTDGGGIVRVGLLNFDSSEVARWRSMLPAADVRAVSLAPAADDITWKALYPTWIDEDGNRSSCPSLPDPDPPLHDYDLVAVKLPCRRQGWSRDVRRFHLQLSAAKLALHDSSSSIPKAGMVLILTESKCLPLPNLFPCKHLLSRHAHAWLYRPDAAYLRRRLNLPVGSCQLAVPSLRAAGATPRSSNSRQAYATVLHSADAYVCGAIALAQSIRQTGSTRDLVALVDAQNVGAEQRAALVAAGWQVRPAPRIRNPRAARDTYNEWNYSKFRLWQLTDYDKVVFLDADLLVLGNMDYLFDEAFELSATVNNGARFNSGVMVLEPCNCTFELLMSGIHDIDSYNGGDQGYLNEVFTWWHRLPRRANFLKYVWAEGDRAAQARVLDAEPAEVHAVHYLGLKPWLCYRDYDCNWNVAELRRFASDEAHARWWAVHDRIEPAELRDRFCALPASQMKMLEQHRREAAIAHAPDGHWNRTITDPRRLISTQ